MAIESATFTALPRGIDPDDPGLLRATIFVSWRMDTEGAGELGLDQFGVFRDWPRVLADLQFLLEFDGGPTVAAKPDPDAVPWDAATFATVFTDEVGVRDHAYRDLSERTWHSYPAADVAREVLGAYAAVGSASPESLPPVTTGPLADLVAELGNIGAEPRRDRALMDELRSTERSSVDERKSRRYTPPAMYSSSALKFTAANRFYDRYSGANRVRDDLATAGAPPKPEVPRIDLHGYLAALGDYPVLLRRLGLAVDVILERPATRLDGRFRVVIDNPVAEFMKREATRPWTNVHLAEPLFVLRPRERSFLRDGQLDFHTERLEVHQIDIDGSALKLIQAAATMNSTRQYLQNEAPAGSMTPDEGSLPALRSAGFTVVHRGRVASVVRQVDQSAKAQDDVSTDTPADLFAEDLTRGYRIDVDRDGTGFRTLTARVGDYRVRQPDGSVAALDVPSDEGYVKGASTTSVPGDPDVYLHEAMASWSGWSLVAPRPGHTITPEEDLDTTDPTPKPAKDVPLMTHFAARPGSLTPLRFGSEYRIRGRGVDLAGNSVDEKALDDTIPSDPQVFVRWEPIPHPALLPHRPYGEGESLNRMVIRSTLGLDPAAWTALPRITTLPAHTAADTAYLVDDSRWVAPPRTSQQMAEFYGVFDAALQPGATPADIDAAYTLAAREAGELPPQPDRGPLATAYLPDVGARAVSLRTLPGQGAGTAWIQDWPHDDAAAPWHDRQPFRIEIVSGSGAPTFVAAERVLRVPLPQAEMVRLDLSSAVDERDLDWHGVWNLIRFGTTVARAREGRSWPVTPSTELVLVHAVEKPLTPPVVAVPQTGMNRRSGESFVSLVGTIDNHAKSTGRVDVEAAWSMQLDNPADVAPADGIDGRDLRSTFGHVGDFELEATENQARTGRTDVTGHGMPPRHLLRHDLGDTKHRSVEYHARATTRFKEYLDPAIWEQREDDGTRVIEHVGPPTTLHVPSSRRPDPPDVAYIVPTFSWEEHTESITDPRGGRGPRLARYTVRTRTCGLRVWMRRPWYSSGDGELLGVVVRKQPWLTWPIDREIGMTVSTAARDAADLVAGAIADRGLLKARGRATLSASERLAVNPELAADLTAIGPTLGTLFPAVDVKAPEDLLTAWGADPAFASENPASGPWIHQFGLRTDVGYAVSLDEAPGAEATVIGHTPTYDAERDQWFCDLQIDAGASYTPFIRLALARYQPWSIDGHHLSRVAVADFVQLLPRREARLTRTFASSRGYGVRLSGPAGVGELALLPTAATAADLRRTRRVTATVQARPAGSTDDLQWHDVGEAVDLEANVSGGLDDVRWDGWVPRETAPDGEERRLLLQEFEIHETDPDDEDPFDAVVTRPAVLGAEKRAHSARHRLVYADAFAL